MMQEQYNANTYEKPDSQVVSKDSAQWQQERHQLQRLCQKMQRERDMLHKRLLILQHSLPLP